MGADAIRFRRSDQACACRLRSASRLANSGPRETGLIAHPVDDLETYFVGSWTIERVLRDEIRDCSGVFRGEAVFEPEGGGLRYRESGRLELPGYADDVTRSYRWIIGMRSRAEILFDDGRPFHALDLRNGEDAVRHLCGEDVYDGAYSVVCPLTWRLSWRIEGPRKSLCIESVYRRA